MTRLVALLIPLTAALPSALAAQAVLVGRVLDGESGEPIAAAEIRLLNQAGDTAFTTIASELGEFTVTASRGGVYALEARRVGYSLTRVDSVEVAAEGQTRVEVRLGVDAVPLDPVVVIGREPFVPPWITDFRRRAELGQRVGRGRIFTREDIDRLQPYNATDLLYSTPMRGCEPVVLLDGLPADASIRTVRGDDLEGVEIYRTPVEIPIEYYRDGMCGLIMFWRRADGPHMAPITWRRVAVGAVVLAILGALSWAF